jgi:hypothetical protein
MKRNITRWLLTASLALGIGFAPLVSSGARASHLQQSVSQTGHPNGDCDEVVTPHPCTWA